MCATFRIVYLGDGKTDFRLERTALTDRGGPYDLGECEYHLAMAAEDLAVAHKRREGMGLVCPKNEKMGIYSIRDPDGYWIERMTARPGITARPSGETASPAVPRSLRLFCGDFRLGAYGAAG